MILFTNGDMLDESIEEFLEEAGDELQGVMNKFGNRYHVFNNQSASNDKQVSELLEKIEILMEGENGNVRPVNKKPMSDAHLFQELQEYIDQIQLPSIEFLNEEHVKHEDYARETLRVVLLGRAGVGKSATGNTVLDRDAFESRIDLSSVTKVCERAEGNACGRNVAVVDTPGFFDSISSLKDVEEEMVRSVSQSAPGPHAFILVISLKDRLTAEAISTLKDLDRRFGDEFKKYTIILFSHFDTLGKDQTIQGLIDFHEELRELLGPFEDRILTFDNSKRDDRDQVRALIEKIDGMVERNGGGCYTDEMYRRAEEAIREGESRLHQAHGKEMDRQAEELFQQRLLRLKAQRQVEDGPGSGNGPGAGPESEPELKPKKNDTWYQKLWARFMSLLKTLKNKIYRKESEKEYASSATAVTALRECSPYTAAAA